MPPSGAALKAPASSYFLLFPHHMKRDQALSFEVNKQQDASLLLLVEAAETKKRGKRSRY